MINELLNTPLTFKISGVDYRCSRITQQIKGLWEVWYADQALNRVRQMRRHLAEDYQLAIATVVKEIAAGEFAYGSKQLNSDGLAYLIYLCIAKENTQLLPMDIVPLLDKPENTEEVERFVEVVLLNQTDADPESKKK